MDHLTEIEAKLKIESLEPVRQKLKELGARFCGHLDQRDIYFDDKNASMRNSDKCLRLRHQKTNDQSRNMITYKGPKQIDDLKKRTEIEIGVDDAQKSKYLIEALGYWQSLQVHKNRELWLLDECEIALDELDELGCFIEIEGPRSDLIHKIKEKLALEHCPNIKESYACLLADKLNQTG